jgi:cell division protein FtsI (penicillin-binding protein 3)
MIVVIDSPTGFAAYGGDVSAPVFKEIADKIYAVDLELNPSSQDLIASEEKSSNTPFVKAGKADEIHQILEKLGVPSAPVQPEEWVKVVANQNQINWKTNDTDAATVPDVSGLSLRDALFILENKGIRVNYSGRGIVKSQSLNPGTPLQSNAIIKLELG